MQHYVIIGNGVAGIEAAFAIRSRRTPEQARITVISSETDYFFSRTALMYAYMDVMERKDLEPFERGAYDKQRIDLVRDHVIDLDADNQRITLRDGGEMEYDKLLLAVGAKPRMFGWDGIDSVEDGIVHFVSMQDLDECERLTWSSDRAVVIGGGLIGIELVECLHHHGVDVTFLVREPYYWPMALGAQEGEMISRHIRDHGIDLRHEEEMVRVETDESGRVARVHTDADDVIDCQMLGVCVGVVSNNEWLLGCTTPPAIGRGITVNRSFETSLPNVYAAGDCCEIEMGGARPLIETIWYSAKLHGRLAGCAMIGDEVAYTPPLFYNATKFMEIEYTTVGKVVDLPEGTATLYRKHPTRDISQRIVWDEDGNVIGFNMLGSRWDHTILERWILERRGIDYVRSHLREAQFDVEFGRAKLDRFDEQEITL